MKIVDKETFLKMKCPVLFCKYKPQIFGDLAIKLSNVGNNDFCYDLIVEFESEHSLDLCDRLIKEETEPGHTFRLDLYATRRDGLYPEEQLYAVFDDIDVKAIIERLQKTTVAVKFFQF